MKATAWPGLPVLATMIATRDGARTAARFAAAAAGVAAVLFVGLAPALAGQPAAFADNIVAYPLGLSRHLTPAASPLPGHLLAGTGTAGRVAAIALLLAAGAAVGLSLVLRPPRDVRSAGLRLALGLTLLFLFAPAARFGYFAYSAALLGFVALTGPGPAVSRCRAGAGPSARPRPDPAPRAPATPAAPGARPRPEAWARA
jgi:hypothetical protein